MSDEKKAGGLHPPPAETRFKPGVSGNPGGKPVGIRNSITTRFLNVLQADFEQHGADAIAKCRETDPARYVQIVSALLPKQVEQTQPLDDLNDEQLTAAIAFLRSRLADGAGAGINTPTRTQ